jgi:hypothetical protein
MVGPAGSAGRCILSAPLAPASPRARLRAPRVSPPAGTPTISSRPTPPQSPPPAATHASSPPLARTTANAAPGARQSGRETHTTATCAHRPSHDAPIPSPSDPPRRAIPVATGTRATGPCPPSRKKPTTTTHSAPVAPSIAQTLSSRGPALVPSSQDKPSAPRTAWPATPPLISS